MHASPASQIKLTSRAFGIGGACCFFLMALGGCAGHIARDDSGTVAEPWRAAQQMVLVTIPGWNDTNGMLRTYTRTREGWREQDVAIPVTIGHSGAGWGLGLHPAQDNRPQGGPQKREGDGRSPAGVFAIGEAFGYDEHADTALPYAQMHTTSYCMDVVASPLYNRIFDAAQVGDAAVKGSSEPMRLDLHHAGDMRYRNGFVIEHNPDGVKQAGSCIFAHLWKSPGEPTTGCTAMAAPSMQRLYAWLRPVARPVFVLLPQAEYDRLRGAWDLPTIEATH